MTAASRFLPGSAVRSDLNRGMTLLEVILASVLLLLLLGCLFALVGPMLRASRLGSSMSDLRQMAALTLESIAREVDQTGAPGIRLYGPVLSIQQVETVSATGSSLWSREVHLYAWDATSGTLRRLSFPPMPSGVAGPDQTRPYAWQPGDLSAALAGRGRLLCTDLVDFQVSGLSSQGLRPPLLVRLRLQREQQTFQLEQAMQPGVRNLH